MACGQKKGFIHVDHIKPRSIFPSLELDISNLQILCEACNLGKGAWDQTDWRPKEQALHPKGNEPARNLNEKLNKQGDSKNGNSNKPKL